MSKLIKHPKIDMNAVREGDKQAFAVAVAACADRWFQMAGAYMGCSVHASHVASQADTAKAGLLAAALDLRELLAQSPNGRQVLRDFGFELDASEVSRPVGCNAKCTEPTGFDSLAMPIYPQESSSGAMR